jgi:hypothetical protein
MAMVVRPVEKVGYAVALGYDAEKTTHSDNAPWKPLSIAEPEAIRQFEIAMKRYSVTDGGRVE